MPIFTLGEYGFLLTIIALVYLILTVISNCLPTSDYIYSVHYYYIIILLINSESFPDNNADSSRI